MAVSETFYDSNETMLAQIQTGAVYDLIVPSDYMISIMITDGLLLPLQHDAIPNIENLELLRPSPTSGRRPTTLTSHTRLPTSGVPPGSGSTPRWSGPISPPAGGWCSTLP